MDWTAIVAALAGGGVGIAGTLGAAMLAARHAEQTRWDHEQATTLGEFVELAACLEGWHLRRGQSGPKGEPPEMQAERRLRCENGLDQLFAKAARLRALSPELTPLIERVFLTERSLRRAADATISERGSEWDAMRDEHRGAIDDLGYEAARLLKTHRS